MKKTGSFLLLLLMVSCGKNAFLSKDSSSSKKTPTLTPGKVMHLGFDPSLDFGSHLINNEVEASVQLINDGDVVIDKISFDIASDAFMVKETDCRSSSLELNQACDVIISFRAQEVKDFRHIVYIKAISGESEQTYPLEIRATGLSRSMPAGVDGPLSLGYLDDEFVNFGRVDVGSTYKHLIYINAIRKHKVNLVGFRTYDHNNSQIYYSDVKGSCTKTIDKDCFLGLYLKPKKTGSFKEVLFIDYTIGDKDVVFTVPVNIRYKAKNSPLCYDHFQDSHPAVTGKKLDTQLEKMSFPYLFESAQSRAYLTKLGNTQTNTRRIVFFRTKYYNEDTQLGFAFPVYKGKEKIYDANILIDVEKYVSRRDLKKDTEMFCSSEFKTCSGTQFTEREYAKLINPEFSVNNARFSKELMIEGTPYCYLIKYLKWKKSLSLRKYLGIKAKDLNSQVEKDHMLNFVLTDDIRLKKNPILISSKKTQVQCK